MANGQDETERPPPNGTNNTDNDEIEELPSKERLERLKLQAEIKEIEKPFYFKKSFIATILSLVVSLGVAGYFSGWFDIKLKRLENEKILIRAEKIKLENEKLLLQKEYYVDLRSYFKNIQVGEKKPEVKERLDQYIEILPKVKEQYEYTFEDWYNKGIGEYAHGKYDEAINSFENAIKKDPTNPYVYNARGTTYVRIGKDEEALKDYNKSIELLPSNPLPHSNKGFTYLRRGQIEDAEREVRIVEKLFKEGKVNEGEKAGNMKKLKELKEGLGEAKR